MRVRERERDRSERGRERERARGRDRFVHDGLDPRTELVELHLPKLTSFVNFDK